MALLMAQVIFMGIITTLVIDIWPFILSTIFKLPHHLLGHGWQVVCASAHWPIYTPAFKPIKACKTRADDWLVIPLYYWHWIRLFICHIDDFYR